MQATLEHLRCTVENADAEKQLLQEQNLQLAEQLATMQAFIEYKVQNTKTAGASVGTWLKGHRGEKAAAGTSAKGTGSRGR